MLLELESEGRTVITDHKAFILINVYCPAIRNEERLEYKIAFHELLTRRIEALREASKNVILVVRWYDSDPILSLKEAVGGSQYRPSAYRSL